MHPFQLANFNWNIFQSSACFGHFQTRLNVAALAPLVLIACVFIVAVGYAVWRALHKRLRSRAKIGGELRKPMLHEDTQTSQVMSPPGPDAHIPTDSDRAESARSPPNNDSSGADVKPPDADAPSPSKPGEMWEIVTGAMLRALPITLWCTYLVLPDVASLIFSSFVCDPFKYDDLSGVSWYMLPSPNPAGGT
jgi:hypothetical protein